MESERKDWRQLCAAAADADSEKLVSLVNQIIEALDERDQKLPPATTRDGCREQA